MKALLVPLLYAVTVAAPTFGQGQSALASAQSACGSGNVNFAASEDWTQQPIPQSDSDNALVFVVQESNALTIKVGMDGAWVRANRGNSYTFFHAKPGEHHLCVNWQSRIGWLNKTYAMSNFNAEAGRVYCFRVRTITSQTVRYLDLDSINADQGKYLVASSPLSVWHIKK